MKSTFSIRISENDYEILTSATPELLWTPKTKGTYIIVAEVEDELGNSAVKGFYIEVN